MAPLTAQLRSLRPKAATDGFFYVPNGVNMQEWKPTEEGDDSVAVDPGAAGTFQEDTLVLSGLTCDKARANGDGPATMPAMSAFSPAARPQRRTAQTFAQAFPSIRLRH